MDLLRRTFGTSLTLEEVQVYEATLATTRDHVSPAVLLDGAAAASSDSEGLSQQTGSDPQQYQDDSERNGAGEGRALTFAELKALIEEGKTDGIPNNKVIPEVINDATPSQSTAPVRKKPWE